MKVALIDPIAHHGGQHYYTDQLARGLGQAGVDLLVYGLAGESFCTRQNIYAYLPVFDGIYGEDPAPLRGLRFVLGLLRIFFDILHRKVDIVHINVWQWSVREVLQVFLARAARKKIVVTIHDVETFGGETSEARRKIIMNFASGFVIHNSFSFSCIPSRYLQGKETAVIPLVCQVAYVGETATREGARDRLHLAQDSIVLLYFGNPRHEKGLDIALQAMTHLRDIPGLLMLTGGRMRAAQEKEFRTFIHVNGLQKTVRMDVGTVPDDVAFDYYSASDVVVTPYRKVYESGVAIMAASCARPIIASDLPVFVEFTEGGRAGLLFRSEDAEHLAKVIRSALKRPDELHNMGEFAQRNILHKRNATRVGKATAELYKRV